MSKNERIYTLQHLMCIQHACMIHFEWICEKHGVNLKERRPTCGTHKSMVGNYLPLGKPDYPDQLFYHHGEVAVLSLPVNQIKEIGMEEYLKPFQDHIENCAIAFATIVKSFPDSDLLFSNMPPEPHLFQSLVSNNPDTGFYSCLTEGKVFGQEDDKLHTFIFSFDCVIVDRWREAEKHPVYGSSYMKVKIMTPEQREKFDKQPTEKEDV